MACEAERPIGLSLDRGPALFAPNAPPAKEGAPNRADASQSQPGPAKTVAGRAPPPAIGCEDAGWEWINWVRAGLRDGSVAVDAAGAWLHNIAGEAYVVSSACFAAFAATRELAPATVRNRVVVRLGRHRSRASRSGGANPFRSVLADGPLLVDCGRLHTLLNREDCDHQNPPYKSGMGGRIRLGHQENALSSTERR